jgi:hypothetical protein
MYLSVHCTFKGLNVRVWECIRKLNPGGKGRRYWFRRGGTKTISKAVKGSHFDHRSRRIRVMANRIHFATPKSKPFGKTNWTDSISLPWLFKRKTGELRLLRQSEKLKRHHAGREGARQQVTICYQETTVHFSAAIDRDSVSPGIFRALRDGWRTINCAVFITDKRSALSLCPAQGRTNLVAVRIRCVSVLRTHPHMYPRSSAPLDV